MIDRLIGVVHCTEINFAGAKIEDRKVQPSCELFREILSYPPGTVVGLEYSSQFNRPFLVSGEKVAIPPVFRFYWQRLGEICKTAGHKIVYLESFQTYVEYVQKALELHETIKKFHNKSNKKKKALYIKSYELQVEKDYIFEVKRESAILRKIQETRPTVVILGQGHTEYITQTGVLAGMGLEVKKYQTESPGPFLVPRLLDSELPTPARIDEAPRSSPNVISERISLERKYKVITEGKVTDGKPNLIGTWDARVPKRGFFEVYVEDPLGNEFRGRIEDCLGSATFSGIINNDVVVFTKTYIPGQFTTDGYSGAILFRGERDKNGYKGRFSFIQPDGTEIPGLPFTLQKVRL